MKALQRRVDATGRNTARRSKKSSKWQPESPFAPMPLVLVDSLPYRSLNAPARRLLDFIIREHLLHFGQANGKLHAPYAQLERWGISSSDIRPSLDMLEAFGLIWRTNEPERLGRREKAAQYALTWLPTADGAPPTDTYKRVTVGEIAEFLRQHGRRSKRRRLAAPHP
jgi:hypothetical protein